MTEGKYDLNKPAGRLKLTPLGRASSAGFYLIAKELIKHGANVDGQNGYGSTPLHGAARGGHLKTMNLLIKNNANLNARNENGITPLYYSIVIKDTYDEESDKAIKGTQLTDNQYMIIKTLVEKGADLNIKNSDGKTALDLAVTIKAKKAISLLRKHGAKKAAELK